MTNTPIKRHQALQNLSREHHDALVFVLRLKKGLAKNAKISDMQNYCNWFWKAYLVAHFQMEEVHLFPLLGDGHLLIISAKKQHRQLKQLFNHSAKNETDFKQIVTLLEKHIRFEERKLFNLIQNTVAEERLKQFEKLHSKQQICGNWTTQFWQ